MQIKRIYITVIVFLAFLINANCQSKIVIEDVIQYLKLEKSLSDTGNVGTEEFLTSSQLNYFGNSLSKIKEVRNGFSSSREFQLFDDVDAKYFSDPARVMSRIIYQEDSVLVEHQDSLGNTFFVPKVGNVDSTWFFNSVKAIRFKEDWHFDLDNFTCSIESKMFMPCVNWKYKEDIGPIGFFWIKPLKNADSKKVLKDTVVTDVFLKQIIRTWDYYEVNNSNAKLDDYRVYTLIHSIIEKLKNGELKAYEPDRNFKKKISKSRIKELFAEEFVPNKFENFPVAYKNYAYRFKMIERWYYDEQSLNFKKEALGVILMKKNEPQDYLLNDEYNLSYTFTKVAYIPFKKNK